MAGVEVGGEVLLFDDERVDRMGWDLLRSSVCCTLGGWMGAFG